jgi:hypothetical protein
MALTAVWGVVTATEEATIVVISFVKHPRLSTLIVQAVLVGATTSMRKTNSRAVNAMVEQHKKKRGS